MSDQEEETPKKRPRRRRRRARRFVPMVELRGLATVDQVVARIPEWQWRLILAAPDLVSAMALAMEQGNADAAAEVAELARLRKV